MWESQDELIISLEKHFDLELTDKAVMSKTFLELCVMGNIDCDEPDMIDFEIYRVVRNSKMRRFMPAKNMTSMMTTFL